MALYLQCLVLTILSTLTFVTSHPPLPMFGPPLAGPGLGLVGPPPPPLLFPPPHRPRPRRILIIRPPPGAHFPFSDNPMRLGFRPLPPRPFGHGPRTFRPSLPSRRPSRRDDIVRHMASKYGYQRPSLYRGGVTRRPEYPRGSRPLGGFRPRYNPFDERPRFPGYLDDISGRGFGMRSSYRGRYPSFPDRSYGPMSGRIPRQPLDFGYRGGAMRREFSTGLDSRTSLRSSDRRRTMSRPKITLRPSGVRSAVARGAFSGSVKSGLSKSFGSDVLDLSKTRSMPVNRRPVLPGPIFDGAVDLSKVPMPDNIQGPVPGPVKKKTVVPKPLPPAAKKRGPRRRKVAKQRRTRPIKAVVKEKIRGKRRPIVAKPIPKLPPKLPPKELPLPPKPKAMPIDIPVKPIPKLPVVPPAPLNKLDISIPPPEPKVIPKIDKVVPPVLPDLPPTDPVIPPVLSKVPPIDTIVPPMKPDIAPTVVVEPLPKPETGIDTQPPLTLDTVVDIHTTKPKVDAAGPANLLATSQSLNVDPLAPGVSIVELGPGKGTSTILSGNELAGLGNVDVLTLSTEGFAALEKHIQSGKAISADVLDSIIGKGGGRGSAGIGKGEPAPEIVVIDHPSAGHGSGHGAGHGAAHGASHGAALAKDIIPPPVHANLENNNAELPHIARATKVLSVGHAGHSVSDRTMPIGIPGRPSTAEQAILDLSVPMHGGQHPAHSLDGVGTVGASVGSVEAKGTNDLLGIFAVPSGSKFPSVPKSVSSIPSAIGKLLTGGTNDHTAHATH